MTSTARVVTEAGQRIEVRDAFGNWLPRIALGPVDRGDEFAIVWACRVEAWEAWQPGGEPPTGTPWPIEDVRSGGAS